MLRQMEATFSDREHQVSFPDSVIFQLELSDELEIFQTFQRTDQGSVPASHFSNQQIFKKYIVVAQTKVWIGGSIAPR